MITQIPCYNKPFVLDFDVQCIRAQKIRIVAWDASNKCTKYEDRTINITQAPRHFKLSFPASPEKLTLSINGVDAAGRGEDDKSIRIYNIKPSNVKNNNCSLGGNDKVFFDFVKNFSEQAGYLPAGIYTKGKYKIIYNTQIKDGKSGNVLNTPARIGHSSGIIEVSQEKFLNYSIPARLIVLLHEGGHKFYNPANNAKVENEVSADLNALYIYLCKGYPPHDARVGFASVFAGADNDLNRRRMAIIEDFITRFENGEVK